MKIALDNLKKKKEHTLKLEKNVITLGSQFKESIRQDKCMRRRLIEMEAQKRRRNLMFFGVPEVEGNSCLEELSLFMREQLHVDTPCELLGTRRVGHLKADGTRPTVTTFVVPLKRQKF